MVTASCAKSYRFGPYRIDGPNGLLWRADHQVRIPPRVLAVLIALIEQDGGIVSKDLLIEKVWGGAFIEESNITKCIAEIRRILRPGFGEMDPIQTLSKKGYRVVIPVEIESAPVAEPAVDPQRAEDGRTLTEPDGPMFSAHHQMGAAHFPPAPEPAVAAARSHARTYVAAAVLALAIAVAAIVLLKAQPKISDHRTAIAVLGIRNISNDRSADWLSTALSETLTSELQSGVGLIAIGTDRVSSMRVELALRPDTIYDLPVLRRIRNSLGCQLAVTGTVLPSGSALRLDLQIRDTNTGEIRGTLSSSGSTDDLLGLIAHSGMDLRRVLGERLESGPARAPQVVSAQALLLYSQGIEHLRSGDATGAQALLTQAAGSAKDYAPIHEALSNAWSLMGFDGRAREEADLANQFTAALPREQQLRVEARSEEAHGNWGKAAESWSALRKFYPDELDYTEHLAAALIVSGKPRDALALLRALHSRDPRMLLVEARASLGVSDYPAAIRDAGEALTEARSRSAQFVESRALSIRGEALKGLSEFQKARADFREAGQISAGLSDRSGAANAFLLEAQIVRLTSNSDATALVEQALAIGREIGNRSLTMSALGALSSLHRGIADMTGALKLAEESLAIARETGNAEEQAGVLIDLGNILNNTGRPQEARQRYEEAVSRSTEIGYRRGITLGLGNLGVLDYFSGDVARATTRFEEALRLKRETGDRDSIAYTLIFLGRVSISAGDLVAARRYLEEADKLVRAIGEESVGPAIYLARVDMAEGHPEKTEPVLTALAARHPKPSPGVEIWLALADSWLLRGDPDRARDASSHASALAAKSPNRADFGIPAGIVAARIEMGDGQFAQARAHLNALLAEAQRLNSVPNALSARLEIARLERRSGNLRGSAETVRELKVDSMRAGFGSIAAEADRIAKEQVPVSASVSAPR